MKKLTLFFLLLLSAYLLAACAPKTEEEQLAAINKRIAPDGYVTKTHLYIHWPAVYTEARRNDPGGKEIVPAVTLKIPIEYLSQGLFSYVNMAKQRFPALRDSGKDKIDYESRYRQGMFIQNNKITSVYLRLQPGAKPDELMIPYKEDTPEVARIKLENFFNEYTVTIHRDWFHVIPVENRSSNNSSIEKPPASSCTSDANTYCHVYFSLGGHRVDISGVGEALENYYKFQAKEAESSSKKRNIVPKKSKDLQRDDLPKWHEKVNPTLTLLNGFILPKDNPEVKGMFTVE